MKRKLPRPSMPEQPMLKLDGPTFLYLEGLKQEARRSKQELAALRARMADWMYENSEPMP